jgi:signal peptidase I
MTPLHGGPQHLLAPGPGTKALAPAHPGRRFLAEVGFLLLVVLVASFVLKTFVIQSFYIPSGSMIPTLEKQDRVIVSKLAPEILDVHRGDIVVFHDPGGWTTTAAELPDNEGARAWLYGVAQALGFAPVTSEEFLIKRIIGLPGDEVSCEGGGAPVVVNGTALDEPYVFPGAEPSVDAFDVVVPDGAVWVMGDNRPNSWDSRAHQDQALKGAVAVDDLVGVAMVRTWPLSRFGLLRNPGSVFAEVKAPS